MFFLEGSNFTRMKNKYLAKYLCITLASAMVVAGPVSSVTGTKTVHAAEDFTDTPAPAAEQTNQPATPEVQQPTETSAAPESQPTETPETTPTETPDPNPTGTPDPGATDTPSPEPTLTPEPTVTPEPSVTPGASETPTPSVTPGASGTPTPTPSLTPVPEETIQELIKNINALAKEKLTLKHENQVKALRATYDALPEEQKTLVTNYKTLENLEKQIADLKKQDEEKNEKEKNDLSDGTTTGKTGTPVYYSSMVSNLHAGREFYLDSLKQNYQLSFSDDFASVMDQIESEYKAANKLTDASDTRANGLTASSDSLLVRNWQDILAVYVYEQSQKGVTEFQMDASAKDDLAKIFAQMNPIERNQENPTHVSYGNYHINQYIKTNKIAKDQREVLKKYTETDCKLLCAVVTDAKGFIRQSVGDDVSEERVNVIAAAYSLVGEVGYFWGGKSTTIGWDSSWGTAEKVDAAGSPSTGTTRAYGLDCSGFVTWSVINGYLNQGMQGSVGDGTSDQWVKANVVSEQDAQPGDLVFQNGPEAGANNHVGIICGKTDSGDWIAVHCSSSKNGVTVGEAYGASFRYIRQPSFYPTDAELAQMISDGENASNAEAVEVPESATPSLAAPERTDAAGTTAGLTDDTAAGTAENTEETDPSDIEVIFEDKAVTDNAGAAEEITSGTVESGNAQITDTLQGILDQNAAVSNSFSVSEGTAGTDTEPDFSDIEVIFKD